ncbi:YciI family protein [Pseudonocardia sp. GCM10023141]|uniref:YciI family protein n=1 Tax=Pseudonocardia sp. GCM10023141 TaxID=3252653 RepID=UPI0036069776
MRYLILIYGNPASREVWRSLSVEQRAAGIAQYQAFNAELDASGERVASESLLDASTAKRVTPRGATVTTTDGPFAESKEHLAGFYLVDCDSMERAVEIGARIPEAQAGFVEVRPVRGDLAEFLA